MLLDIFIERVCLEGWCLFIPPQAGPVVLLDAFSLGSEAGEWFVLAVVDVKCCSVWQS